MYRKDLLIKEGLYNPDYRHREEKELGTDYKINTLLEIYRYFLSL